MSGYFDDSPCTGFEGPEKRLEIVFRPKNHDSAVPSRGLRLITKSDWQAMCTVARCNIISQTSNQFFDSFVLSESSLFVYPNMVMIKTCGTTALLQAIAKILEYGERYNLEVAQVLYSRKNFLYPTVQPEVHRDWSNEVSLLTPTLMVSLMSLDPPTKTTGTSTTVTTPMESPPFPSLPISPCPLPSHAGTLQSAPSSPTFAS